MVVRRYVVKDMPEAVLLIRKDLGKEAVILSTRKIYVKKWLGFWRMRRIEVMAAAGGDVPVRKKPSPSVPLNVVSGNRFVETEEGGKSPVIRSQAETYSIEKSTQPHNNQSHDGELYRNNENIKREISNLAHEIKELKGYITQSVSPVQEIHNINRNQSKNRIHELLLKELQEEGFSHTYASSLVGDFLSSHSNSPFEVSGQIESIQIAKQQLANFFIRKLEPIVEAEPLRNHSRVILFVGPTGVGKTTTIAKLAALHVLSGTRKVGLLTTDTFRVAAVEQLKTYAGILHVPIAVINRDENMIEAFKRQSDRDLILIDTTGRNYRDSLYIEEMRELTEQIPVDEIMLVLPMTGKISDLYEVAKAFEPIKFDKFLFTKMDETSSFGSMVELIDKCPHPLSYITTGQSVPDDLEIASVKKLVERVFVEGAHG